MVHQIVWTPGVALEALIQQVVEAAMAHYRGNKTATAQSLGIAIRTLDSRLEKYAKEKVEFEERAADARSERQKFQARQRAIPAGARWDTSATPSIYAPGLQAESGVLPQSLANASAKHAVPVPERQEVQSVLPSASASRGSRKSS